MSQEWLETKLKYLRKNMNQDHDFLRGSSHAYLGLYQLTWLCNSETLKKSEIKNNLIELDKNAFFFGIPKIEYLARKRVIELDWIVYAKKVLLLDPINMCQNSRDYLNELFLLNYMVIIHLNKIKKDIETMDRLNSMLNWFEINITAFPDLQNFLINFIPILKSKEQLECYKMEKHFIEKLEKWNLL